MSLFEDGQTEIPLDDESLFDATDEVEANRQDTIQPQGASDSAADPGENRTSDSADAAASHTPEETGQATVQKLPENDAFGQQGKPAENPLQHSYNELRTSYTRTTQELAEQKRQNAALSQQLKRMETAVIMADPEKREKAIKEMMDNPVAWLERTAAPLLEQKVNESLAEIRQQSQRQEDGYRLNTALAEVGKQFNQAVNDEGRKLLVEKMVEVSIRYGDGYLWRKNPGGMLTQAALELWGMPKIIDQQAVDAASAAGRAQALAELQAREQAKSQIAQPQTANNRDQTAELSEEEKIIQGIFASIGSGLFD